MYSVSSLCVCVYTHTFLVLWGKGFPSNYNDTERQYIKHNYIKEMFFVFELVSFFNFFPLTCELEENEIYRLSFAHYHHGSYYTWTISPSTYGFVFPEGSILHSDFIHKILSTSFIQAILSREWRD